MDAIPYVDSLVKEYLLFRGFTGTLRAFNKDLASDRGCGFQADQLCELVFRKLLPLNQATELMEVLDFLSNRVYSRLPGSYEEVIRKLEVSILRAYIVRAVQAKKLAVVQDFFSQYGEILLSRAESSDWLQWFALPYLKEPSQDPRFQVFFSKEWVALVEASFRNFLAEAIQHLPPPALLRFDTDRLQRSSLQKQVDRLHTENAALKEQLALSGRIDASHGSQQSSQQKQQAKPGIGAGSVVHSDQRQAQLRHQPQQHASLPQEQKSAAPPPASHSLQSRPDMLRQGPASETSQWVLADRDELLQEEVSDISARELAEEGGQQALSLSVAELQPTWSASLASLDATVLDENEGGALCLASTVGDDALSLDTEASSPRMIAQEAQAHTQDVASTPSEPSVSFISSQSAFDMQIQHKLSNGSQQSAAHAQYNDTRHHQSPDVAHSGRSATDSDGASQAALRQAPSSATLGSMATGEQLVGHDGQGITCCSFSPSGQNLATASADGVVRISAPASLQGNASRAAVLNCGASVSVVAWDHRADKVMLVGTKGRGVKAWHLDTKSMISHIPLDSTHPTVLDIACSPTDPSFVCAAASSETGPNCSGTLTAWNMRAFKKLRSFDVPDDSAVGSVSFSPDGHTLVAGSSDGCLRVYDVHSNRGAPVAVWPLHSRQEQAPAVRYFADGSGIVSLSQTGQLQQWDLRRLSSKKLGQPQWTVDLSTYCLPLPKAQRLRHVPAVAQSSRLIVTTSASNELPVVRLHTASRVPTVQSIVAARRAKSADSVVSASFVSAVHWHPNSSTLCCGLNDGQIWLQHVHINE